MLGSRAHALLIPCFLLMIGCGDNIGDACSSSSDCSDNGDRVCDLAQPGGYCTIFGCDPDTCPGGSRCVEWRFEPARTAESWCMKSCKSDRGCRSNSGYHCVSPSDIDIDGDDEPEARFIDLDAGIDTAMVCAAFDPEASP